MYGDHDAEFNWCERDYASTPFVAELWNTLTSLLYCVEAMLMLRFQGAALLRVPYAPAILASVFCTGVGSTLFHATLRYDMQLLDELPMYALSLAAACALRARADLSNQGSAATTAARAAQAAGDAATRRAARRFAWAGVASWAAVAGCVYGAPRGGTAHEAARGFMTCAFCAVVVYVFFAATRAAREAASLLKRVPSAAGGMTAAQVHAVFDAAFLCFLVGCGSWIVDNFYCAALRALAVPALGLALPYPQLHAVGWHGGSCCAVWLVAQLLVAHDWLGRRTRERTVKKKAADIALVWALGVIPFVREVPRVEKEEAKKTE